MIMEIMFMNVYENDFSAYPDHILDRLAVFEAAIKVDEAAASAIQKF